MNSGRTVRFDDGMNPRTRDPFSDGIEIEHAEYAAPVNSNRIRTHISSRVPSVANGNDSEPNMFFTDAMRRRYTWYELAEMEREHRSRTYLNRVMERLRIREAAAAEENAERALDGLHAIEPLGFYLDEDGNHQLDIPILPPYDNVYLPRYTPVDQNPGGPSGTRRVGNAPVVVEPQEAFNGGFGEVVNNQDGNQPAADLIYGDLPRSPPPQYMPFPPLPRVESPTSRPTQNYPPGLGRQPLQRHIGYERGLSHQRASPVMRAPEVTYSTPPLGPFQWQIPDIPRGQLENRHPSHSEMTLADELRNARQGTSADEIANVEQLSFDNIAQHEEMIASEDRRLQQLATHLPTERQDYRDHATPPWRESFGDTEPSELSEDERSEEDIYSASPPLHPNPSRLSTIPMPSTVPKLSRSVSSLSSIPALEVDDDLERGMGANLRTLYEAFYPQDGYVPERDDSTTGSSTAPPAEERVLGGEEEEGREAQGDEIDLIDLNDSEEYDIIGNEGDDEDFIAMREGQSAEATRNPAYTSN